MREKLQDAIARIKRYEAKLDRCNAVHIQFRKALEDFRSIQDDVRDLERYYSGRLWRADFERDERGMIPGGIKRGILSEDGIYDMLIENQELISFLEDAKTE